MAPIARKGKENGKKLVGKAAKEETGDEDDILDRDRYGHWTDSVLLLSAARAVASAIRAARKSKDEGPGKKNGKAAEKAVAWDKEVMAQKLGDYKIPLGLLTIFVLTCALIAGGEIARGQQDRAVEVADDFYGVLGVPRDSDTADVKRAYKILAKRWHPDKNPNCSTCQQTFSKIAEAYETLADDKKRAAYDESGGIATADLQSPRSVPLTRENFERTVTFSNDVWIVQVFKPEDSYCAQFHPFWEHQIQKHGNLVRFGRIDVTSDPGKWLPVKIRVLPTVLKFGRHLGSPEILPLTQAHETPTQFNKFVVTSFPNIGLPLQADGGALSSWLRSSSRYHKVLFAIPGKSEEERYKSHLGCRALAAKWSELFEFRIAETAKLLKVGEAHIPAKVLAALPDSASAASKGAMLLFAANGDDEPKASVIIDWPAAEDEIVLHLLDMAERAAPALSARSAELLCKSFASLRVYCLVLVDPSDAAVTTAVKELKESRVQYKKEVMDIREQGHEVAEDEDNFIVTAVRLFTRQRGLQASVASCRAPLYGQVEQILAGSGAFLMDLDIGVTGRAAALKDMSSFRNIYPQIGYEDSLTWVDDAFHPFLSLPDCDEGLLEYFISGLRSSGILELFVQLVAVLCLLEAIAKATVDGSVRWGIGAIALVLLVLLRSPPFLRKVSGSLPGFFFSPPLLAAS
mmetsp:Transcript_3593/g.9044  ORF Transcript_3593/g.9044 Transcript_3593/m.9044 type:complete len:688 (-) Transcript_3593:97-2160(-)